LSKVKRSIAAFCSDLAACAAPASFWTMLCLYFYLVISNEERNLILPIAEVYTYLNQAILSKNL